MTDEVNVIYIVIICLVVFGFIVLFLWEMMGGVKYVRLSAMVIVGAIEKMSPIIGGALMTLVKTFVWF
jgi:hypothetical protein